MMIVGSSLLCLLICLPLFMYYKQIARIHLASLYKSTGTLCAAIPALVAAIKLDPRCYICFAGLVLCAIADYMLEFHELWGAGFFMAGHFCFISFFLQIVPVSIVHLVTLIALAALFIFTLYRNRKQIGKALPSFAVYGSILCLMTASAIGCLSSFSVRSILLAAGGSLFFISDFILLHRTIYTAGKTVSWIIMITYYAAQLLIGFSCLA